VPGDSARQLEALDHQARRLMAAFTRAGYEYIAPSVIQPAGLFLDVIGERLRARTYVFTDPDGAELCLRPDLTVPTCQLHLARHPAGNVPARYCYRGSAFRYQPIGADSTHPREFRQAGVECFAAADRERADAEVLAVIAAALSDAGLARYTLRIGDLGLFGALLDAVHMPQRWRRRLRHRFWRPEAFRAELARLTSREALSVRGVPAEIADRLDPTRREEAQAIVAGHLEQSAIELIGTRTLAEITDRLLAEVEDARQTPLEPAQAQLIEDYVAIKGPVSAAADALAGLARGGGVDLSTALDAFERRLALLRQAGVATAHATFSAEFGRDLEYYTGFVFELVAPELGDRSPVAGGGRYDGLMSDVGAPCPVPAVGSCIHTERLLAVGDGSAT
jgi:ATP phosphoribosyltransferase regulatory subunit